MVSDGRRRVLNLKEQSLSNEFLNDPTLPSRQVVGDLHNKTISHAGDLKISLSVTHLKKCSRTTPDFTTARKREILCSFQTIDVMGARHVFKEKN